MSPADEFRAGFSDLTTGDPEHDHAALDDLILALLTAITKSRDPREMRELAVVGLEANKLVPEKWYA